MSLPVDLTAAIELMRPHFSAVALVVARIAPVVFLCPLFGGQAAPSTVRLSLTLALALHAHFAGDVRPPEGIDADTFTLVAAFARELFCGTVIGFIAALPFDAARMGGRFLDTFRGANAEASLPATGSREAATGDLLYQLLCALAFAGPLYRVIATAVLGSFRVAPLGLPDAAAGMAIVELAVARATGALATGISIGAPAAAVSLLVDAALGIAARAAPSLNLVSLGTPVKLLLGASAILLSLGAASDRLLAQLGDAATVMGTAAATIARPS